MASIRCRGPVLEEKKKKGLACFYYVEEDIYYYARIFLSSSSFIACHLSSVLCVKFSDILFPLLLLLCCPVDWNVPSLPSLQRTRKGSEESEYNLYQLWVQVKGETVDELSQWNTRKKRKKKDFDRRWITDWLLPVKFVLLFFWVCAAKSTTLKDLIQSRPSEEMCCIQQKVLLIQVRVRFFFSFSLLLPADTADTFTRLKRLDRIKKEKKKLENISFFSSF